MRRMATSSVSLPGFASPAVGFDQPFEMLEACHQRVQRSLALLGRAVAHIDAHGHDAQSRAALADVVRYFEIAAPAHHEDEERHVFPALLADPATPPEVRAAVTRLQADHERMHAQWAVLLPVLRQWRDAGPDPAPTPAITPADHARIDEVTALYDAHIALEESVAYPAARPLFDAAALAAAGAEMAARRQQGPPGDA